jgi:hypothetical protein
MEKRFIKRENSTRVYQKVEHVDKLILQATIWQAGLFKLNHPVYPPDIAPSVLKLEENPSWQEF